MATPINFRFFILLFTILGMTSNYRAQVDSFQVEGISRTYLYHLPPGHSTSNEYPLVINMHGIGSNAFEQMFYSQFNTVADTANFIIIVYPNGLNNEWNIGVGNSYHGGVNDIGFIRMLIDTMDTACNVDKDRVYGEENTVYKLIRK